MVENDAGILVELHSKEQVLDDLAMALDQLIDDYPLRVKMGVCGFDKIKKVYTWSHRAEYMSGVYKELTK